MSWTKRVSVLGRTQHPRDGEKGSCHAASQKFSNEFKRQGVEEHLSEVSTAAQLMRRHDISSGLLCHWKDPYAKGRYDNPPTQEAALEERASGSLNSSSGSSRWRTSF